VVSSTAYLEYLAAWRDFSVSAYHDPAVRCPAGYGYPYVDPQGRGWACAYTKGKMTPVDLLADDWRNRLESRRRAPPARWAECSSSTCFQRPLSAALGCAYR
jgi:hypothetical protein